MKTDTGIEVTIIITLMRTGGSLTGVHLVGKVRVRVSGVLNVDASLFQGGRGFEIEWPLCVSFADIGTRRRLEKAIHDAYVMAAKDANMKKNDAADRAREERERLKKKRKATNDFSTFGKVEDDVEDEMRFDEAFEDAENDTAGGKGKGKRGFNNLDYAINEALKNGKAQDEKEKRERARWTELNNRREEMRKRQEEMKRQAEEMRRMREAERERQRQAKMKADREKAEEQTKDEYARRFYQQAFGEAYGRKTPHWEVLGIKDTPGITYEQAKAAYRKAALAAHPDHGGSHEKMIKVNNAWAAICKEKKWK